MGLEDLRKVLPYEEFLKRALEDENSDSEIDDIEIQEDDDFDDNSLNQSYQPIKINV